MDGIVLVAEPTDAYKRRIEEVERQVAALNDAYRLDTSRATSRANDVDRRLWRLEDAARQAKQKTAPCAGERHWNAESQAARFWACYNNAARDAGGYGAETPWHQLHELDRTVWTDVE